jgi:hypothetical protein
MNLSHSYHHFFRLNGFVFRFIIYPVSLPHRHLHMRTHEEVMDNGLDGFTELEN